MSMTSTQSETTYDELTGHAAMAEIRNGNPIEVETPTGKVFEARQNEYGLLIISTDEKLFAQTGDEAKQRLANVLRSVATTWSVKESNDETVENDTMNDETTEQHREQLEEAVEQSNLHPKTRQALESALNKVDEAYNDQVRNPAINEDNRFRSARDDLKQVIDAVDRTADSDSEETHQ